MSQNEKSEIESKWVHSNLRITVRFYCPPCRVKKRMGDGWNLNVVNCLNVGNSNNSMIQQGIFITIVTMYTNAAMPRVVRLSSV